MTHREGAAVWRAVERLLRFLQSSADHKKSYREAAVQEATRLAALLTPGGRREFTHRANTTP